MNEKIFLSNNDLENLKIIINYLLNSEQKHYEEHIFNNFEDVLEKTDDLEFIFTKDFYNNPNINHIYTVTKKLQDSLNSQYENLQN